MKFKKISYKNYRCFLDGTIVFSEKNDRNINLLLGPNGGGKTETLFSFWWVLYGFDFSTLRAKESTEYALNLDLYRELEESPVGSTQSCRVDLEFEYEKVTYLVTKICEYKKTNRRITTKEYQELSHYEENFELSLPERDPEKIEEILGRMVPKSILHGIIFDGERMQQLSTTNENSKKAIKGVISDITNVALVEKCLLYLESIRSALNWKLKNNANKSHNESFQDILEREKTFENKRTELREKLLEGRERLEIYEQRCSQISRELEANEKVKEIEYKRKIARDTLKEHEVTLNNCYKNFSVELMDAYVIAAEHVFSVAESTLQNYDVPKDLTAPAVKSILDRTHCICGKPLDEESRKTLLDLINSLPPDNINSTLTEYIRQLRERGNDVRRQTSLHYKDIKIFEGKIKEDMDKIANLNAEVKELTEGQAGDDLKRIHELENESREKREALGRLKLDLPKWRDELKQIDKELSELKKKKDNFAQMQDETKIISVKLDFVEKSIAALNQIRIENKNTALDAINFRLAEAYELLSEDAELGRKIKVIQYDKSKMYNLVVYMDESCNKLIADWTDDGTYANKLSQGKREMEIYEEAIVKCIDPNSTGQSKINTLAFVKAILDYSNSRKSKDGIEIQKEYPLLIDAPFGDISGGNLYKSSTELHNFTNQIILMLDAERYEQLRSNLEQYVSNIYEFKKIEKQHYTVIETIAEV